MYLHKQQDKILGVDIIQTLIANFYYFLHVSHYVILLDIHL